MTNGKIDRFGEEDATDSRESCNPPAKKKKQERERRKENKKERGSLITDT
jgi:hypothetical protein